jgi:lipoyl(octanoyl) transferase
MEVFEKLYLWIDPVKRPGPEAMAVDEWLLETAKIPVLRVYGWAGDWASIGYFGNMAAARALFPGLGLVRRWTGGGMVDHRADWTYSLAAPIRELLANSRGAESYRIIHAALAETLAAEGRVVRMSHGEGETGAASCFQNPVSYDLIDIDGEKIAGAGQRRSRQGLLHQGAVALPCADDADSQHRAQELANRISQEWDIFPFQPTAEDLVRRVANRYSLAEWMNRR